MDAGRLSGSVSNTLVLNVAVHNRALSFAEVQQLFKNPHATVLVAANDVADAASMRNRNEMPPTQEAQRPQVVLKENEDRERMRVFVPPKLMDEKRSRRRIIRRNRKQDEE